MSKGEIPSVIAISLEQFPTLTVYPISNHTNENNSLENPIFERILSSGRVLYGDSYCDKLAEVTKPLITKKCLKQESQFYILKSSISAIISSNDIYLVTSGLLSQLSHPEQLYYLLLREKEKLNVPKPREKHPFLDKNFIDELIEDYYLCAENYEKKIDEIALKSYLEAGFSLFQAVRSLDVLRFSTQPFEEIDILENYFGNSMYIPSSFYDVTDLKGVINTTNQYGQESLRLNFEKRKKNLLNLTSNPTSDNTSQTIEFVELRSLARLQVIEEYLIKTDFEMALYAIAVLEKEISSAENYLHIMKGYAWYGLVAQSYLYDIKRYPKKHIKNNQSESDRFFRLLNRLNSFGIAAIALRYTTDVIADNPEISDEMTVIRDEIVKVLAQSQRFPLEKFSKIALKPAANKTDSIQVGVISKYDKIDLSKSMEVISVDSNEFYFYGIPDLMQNEQFIDKFNSVQTTSSFQDPNVHVAFSSYKGGNINKRKSQKNLFQLQTRREYINKKTNQNTSFIDLPVIFTTQEYNLSAELNQIILQKQYTGALSWGLLSYSHHRIQKSIEPSSSNQLYYQFTNLYKPKVRGVHFIGISVIALPWVITDVFLRGNNSNLISFTYNSELKKIENFEQINLSLAWNKEAAAAQIINQILILNHVK